MGEGTSICCGGEQDGVGSEEHGMEREKGGGGGRKRGRCTKNRREGGRSDAGEERKRGQRKVERGRKHQEKKDSTD